MIPHVCPMCNGEKVIDAGTIFREYRVCSVCEGTGIVWEPEPIPIIKWSHYDIPGLTSGYGGGPER